MTQPEVSQPSAPIVYYSGRATGLAPFLRTVKLALWGVVWLAIYWTLDPGNRELLAAA